MAHMEGLTFNARTKQEETPRRCADKQWNRRWPASASEEARPTHGELSDKSAIRVLVVRIENNIVAAPETSWTQMIVSVPDTVREAKTRGQISLQSERRRWRRRGR